MAAAPSVIACVEDAADTEETKTPALTEVTPVEDTPPKVIAKATAWRILKAATAAAQRSIPSPAVDENVGKLEAAKPPEPKTHARLEDASSPRVVAKATALTELRGAQAKHKGQASGNPLAKPKLKAKAKALSTAQAKAAAKGKAKAKSKAASRINKEFAKSSNPGRPKEFYQYQCSFIEKQVSGPWRVFFSMLGTGFVGVMPCRSSSASSGRVVKHENADSEEAHGDDTLAKETAEGIIVIFVNAPGMALQARNGKVITNYGEALDVHRKAMGWSSQRRDLNNARIGRIMDHQRRGGRVLVAVRGGSSQHFELLGQVCTIDNYEPTAFLLEDGEHLLLEEGSRTVHKAITASCLNSGLRTGVGLTSVQYGKLQFTPRPCLSCCWRPARCVFHFDTLDTSGAATFQEPIEHIKERKLRKRRLGVKQGALKDEGRPANVLKLTTRIKVKTPVAMVKVKVENIDGVDAVGARVTEPISKAEPSIQMKAEEV